MTKNKTVISAVHDDDLVGFLDGLGVLSDVNQGRAKCKFSRDIINLNNLAAVFPESGDIKFVCDRAACLKQLAEYRSELRGDETSGETKVESGTDESRKG
jgi:hypothetical protein